MSEYTRIMTNFPPCTPQKKLAYQVSYLVDNKTKQHQFLHSLVSLSIAPTCDNTSLSYPPSLSTSERKSASLTVADGYSYRHCTISSLLLQRGYTAVHGKRKCCEWSESHIQHHATRILTVLPALDSYSFPSVTLKERE